MYEKKPWLNHYGDSPVSLNYPDDSIYSLVRKNCDKYPGNAALIFLGRKTSRQVFHRQIVHMSLRFSQLGISRGDMVIICLPNIPQSVVAFYALNRLGAIPAPIHPLSAAPEIERYARLVSAKAAITLDGFFPRFDGIIQSAGFKKIIVCSLKTEMGLLTKIGFSLGQGRRIKPVPYSETIVKWADLEREEQLPELETPDPIGADEMALILFSGGTTGEPKAIMLSSRNCNALAMQMYASGGPMVPNDKMLCILPIFHGFGLVVGIHTTLINGGTCVLVPKFKANVLAALVKKYKPQFMAGVPTLYDSLAADKNFNKIPLASFKSLFCGGDSLSPEIKERFEKVLRKGGSNIMLREGYGLTESIAACAITPRNEYRERTIGVPCPDNLFKVIKIDTPEEYLPLKTADTHTIDDIKTSSISECAPLEEGEICICGPTVMLGYYHDKEATDDVLKKHSDGRLWLHTGDIGCMDKDGFFYFKQRAKRIIKTSGIGVYPSQIEDVLNNHPAVRISCVIGVPHHSQGQIPKAFIMLKDGISATEDLKQDIIESCKKQLMSYSQPRNIEFIEKMPLTRVGKVAFSELEKIEFAKK